MKNKCDKRLINNFLRKFSLVWFYKAETQITKLLLIKRKKNKGIIN